MPWSVPFMAASYATRTAAFNMCPFDIPSGWQRQASSLLSEASTTVTTTPSPTRSRSLKAEVIHRRGPWRSVETVEFATLEWVDWFNHQRLLEPIGNVPPAEAEEQYYAMLDEPAMAA
jgi:transposase InsO family protein